MSPDEFINKLRNEYKTIHCADDSYSKTYCNELSIVEAFIEAVSTDEDFLVNGEKATIDELDDSIIQSVVTRLHLVANGKPVSLDPFPVQDDICHHPGCEYDHNYDDDHFHEHCELCQTWLHINMPINIIRHAENDNDFAVCHECVNDDTYIQGGYTDDAGILQIIRADSETMLRMIDVAYKSTQIEGINSGREFFEKREQFKVTYETAMNNIANKWNMGNDDNFNFLKDHANDLLESLYSTK